MRKALLGLLLALMPALAFGQGGTPPGGYTLGGTAGSGSGSSVLTTLPDTAHLLAWYQIKPTETAGALVDYSGSGNAATGTTGTPPTITAVTGGLLCNGAGAVVLPAALNSALTVVVYFSSGAQAVYEGVGNHILSGSNATYTALMLYNTGVATAPGSNRLATYQSSGNQFNGTSNDLFWGTGTVGWAMDSPLDRIYYNGTEYVNNYTQQLGSSAGKQTLGSFQICGRSGNFLNNATIYQMAFYSVVENAANIAAADQVMTNLEVAQGVYKTPYNNTVDTTSVILGTGDSLGSGTGIATGVFAGTGGNNPGSLTLNDTFFQANVSSGGFRCREISSNLPSEIGMIRPTGAESVNVVWCGTNDINAGFTPQQSVGFVANSCRQTKGGLSYDLSNVKCLPVSVISRVSNDTNNSALDQLERRLWSSFADGFVDVAADPNLAPNGTNNTNTLYFQGDMTHPTQHASYNDNTPMFQRAINRLFGPHSFSEATTYTTGAPAASAITAASESTNTVTITSALNPPVGSCAVITGVTPAGYNSPSTGGCWLVLTTSGTNFTFYDGTTGLGNGTIFGTATVPVQKDADTWVILGGSGATSNFTLESCEGYTGQNIYLKATDATAAWTVTSYAPTSELIDGAATTTMLNGTTKTLQAVLTSATAGGCNWITTTGN